MSIGRTPWAIGVQRRQVTGLGRFDLQARAGVSFDPGALVVVRQGSTLAEIPDPANPRTDLILMGTFVGTGLFTASATADTNGGALDTNNYPQKVTIQPLSSEGTGDFSTGTGTNQITSAMVDKPAFMVDNDTFYATDNNGTLSFGGWVGDVDATSGKVTIKHSSMLRMFWELYSAGEVTPSTTSDDTVAGVVTNLPAGSFSGGVWTATSAGAFPTQDTNVVAALGDKFIFPAGTLTTGTVSAANSGVYECTTLGASGVAAVFTRAARFGLGAVIKPKTRIYVGSNGGTSPAMGAIWGGTTWSTRPLTNKLVVGTGDPQLVPDEVTVPVTLSNSTGSTTIVPINANTPVGVSCAVTGGTQAVGTIAFGTLVAPTVGGVGTGTVNVVALKTAYIQNTTADSSVLAVTVRQ